MARADIEVSFCLRSAQIFPVFLLSALTTATLGGALLAHEFWHVGRRGDTAAALVVALPSFFAPFVVPGRHRLVQRMFKGLRAIVVASALLSFGAAATLAIDLSTDTAVNVWVGLLCCSSILTSLALLAWMHSSWKTAPIEIIRGWLRVAQLGLGVVIALSAWTMLPHVPGVDRMPWTERGVDLPIWVVAAAGCGAALGLWFVWVGLRRLGLRRLA